MCTQGRGSGQYLPCKAPPPGKVQEPLPSRLEPELLRSLFSWLELSPSRSESLYLARDTVCWEKVHHPPFMVAQMVKICLQCGRPRFDSGSGRSWRRKWQPTPIFLHGEFHGQRSLWGATLHGVAKSRK